jgi:hypothetical protein
MFKRIRKWWVGKKVESLRSSTVKNPGIEIEAYYDGKKLVVVVVKYLHDSRVEDFVIITSVGELMERYQVKVKKMDDWPEYNEVMIAPSKGVGEFIPEPGVVTMGHLNTIVKELRGAGQVLFTEMHI